MNAARFNRHIAAGRQKAEGNLAALERGYRITLQAAARHAGDRFAALATDHLTADATDPKWTPPQNDQLLDPDAMAADAQKRTTAARQASVKAVVAPALADVGLSYDLTNPLVSGLLDVLGVRAADMGDAVRGDVARVVLDSYQKGLSVADAAAAIQSAVEEIAPVRAAMLARTDLVGIANGASLAAAQMVAGADTGGEGALGYKRWLATEDERTRESHAEADGQIVPIDQPFQVGGEQADYPGSPDLSDEEACNCRCAVTYLDAAEVVAETGESPLALAASGESPTDAVRSRGRMDESPDDTLTADVTITVGDEAVAETTVAPTRWRAVLCVEGEPTEDGRMLEYGSITWRELPLSLGAMFETPHSYDASAEICGRIDTIWRDGNKIMGEGVFSADECGQRAASMVADLTLRGISVDLGILAYELREADPPVATDETDDTPDAEADIADVITEIDNLLFVVTEGVIGAATVCPFQAIAGATIAIVASSDGGSTETATVARDTCFVLTVEQPAPMAELVADGWAPKVDQLAARIDTLAANLEESETRRLDEARSLKALVAAAVEEATVPKQTLTKIGNDLSGLRDELSRRSRTVQFDRDADGKLAGLREG